MAGSRALQSLPETMAEVAATGGSPLERLRATLPTPLRARLHTAGDLARTEAETRTPPPLPTAVEGLDRLLAGGLPRGGLTELVGRRSSGRFSTVLSALAAATIAGEAAALIDLGDGLDPQTAAMAGVVLERLLRAHPRHLKQALISSEILLNAGFPLVVLDLGNPPVPGGRGTEASWLRLARAAQSHRAALLISTPYRVSGTIAAAVVQANAARPLWRGTARSARLLAGVALRLTLERLRGHHARQIGHVRFTAPGELAL